MNLLKDRFLIGMWLAVFLLVPVVNLRAKAFARKPTLGAVSAPVSFDVMINGQTYTFASSAVTFAPKGTEAVRTLSGFGSFVLKGGPVPPPLFIASVTPNPVATGGTITVTGTGFLPGVTLTWRGAPLATVYRSPTLLTATLPLLFGAQTLPLGVTGGGQSASGPLLTVDPLLNPPPPPPGNVVNVRTLGVKGDGVTIDRTALNAAIQNAAPGTTLYFPAGTYLTDDALKVYRNDIGFLGDGDTSILKSVAGSYHFQIGHGSLVTGVSFHKLQLYGTPGQYMAGGLCRGGVLNFGSQGTVFQDCLFTGCSEPIDDAGTTGGIGTLNTVIDRCRFNGWGRMCLFCNGGEQITNCQLIQDDPNLMGQQSSHGVYVHGGASDVLIADCTFQNIRKYSIQAYCETNPSVTSNLQIRRCSFKNSANGIITAHGNADAGILTNSVIDGNTFSGIYAGAGIAIKDAVGLQVTNNGVSAGTGAGIYLGVFAPYEPNYNLTNVQVTGNTVSGCDRGIWSLPSNGGSFTGCTISGNHVSGCVKNYDVTGPGIVFVPGAPAAPARGAGLRPSDDRSSAAKQLR